MDLLKNQPRFQIRQQVLGAEAFVTMFLPTTTRALVLQKAAQEQSPPYHDVVVEERPVPALKDQEVLVRIAAVALNHRDVHITISMEGLVSDFHLVMDSQG